MPIVFSIVWVVIIVSIVLRSIKSDRVTPYAKDKAKQLINQSINMEAYGNVPKTKNNIDNVNTFNQAVEKIENAASSTMMSQSMTSSASSSVMALKAKETKTYRDMEDRKNDWLARELREERKSLYAVNAMFDLKSEHKAHCDANGIDTGTMR